MINKTREPRPGDVGLNQTNGSGEASHSDGVVVRCLADVEAVQVEWLWRPYIPLGKLSLIEGDPGLGKSWLTLAIATAVARGFGLPAADSRQAASVLLASAEDGLADTIKPRLDSMNADASRIFALDGAIIFDEVGLLVLESEILDKEPMLVVIDPIVAYLGARVDIHRANEVRLVLSRLAQIAERRHCAILCVRHLTKGGKDRAIYRGLGSIDFTAAARSVLLVGGDPEDDTRRALVHIKSNLAEMGGSLGYEICDGRFCWTGTSELTAERILAASSLDGNSNSWREAESFLRDVLAEGPHPAKEVLREAKELGISECTLRRVKSTIGVHVIKEGGRFGSRKQRWMWELHTGQDDQGKTEGDQGTASDHLLATIEKKGVCDNNLAEDDQPGLLSPSP